MLKLSRPCDGWFQATQAGEGVSGGTSLGSGALNTSRASAAANGRADRPEAGMGLPPATKDSAVAANGPKGAGRTSGSGQGNPESNNEGGPWPRPDDRDIDLNATNGPRWLDEAARMVQERLRRA